MTADLIRHLRLVALCVALSLLLPLAAGCSGSETVQSKPANYGSYGAEFAKKIASANPARSPGSEGEKKTGDLIIAEFKSLGFEPVVTEFTFQSTDGQTRTSRNISVRIPGTGFEKENTDGSKQSLTRQIIVGAHYDAIATAEQIAQAKAAANATTQAGSTTGKSTNCIPTWADFNGITDNAASIGALMTVAREMKAKRTGYDVILVAFGAGKSQQAGARHFASKMSAETVAATDAMYNMEGIYAGDKLYAHSGRNSILPNRQKDYEDRKSVV